MKQRRGGDRHAFETRIDRVDWSPCRLGQARELGGAKRVFDHLRHSAATEAEEGGVETDKIRHLTAHKDSTMNRETYVQQSAEITVEIQRRRGIIP